MIANPANSQIWKKTGQDPPHHPPLTIALDNLPHQKSWKEQHPLRQQNFQQNHNKS
jgi:hypothetical protein